MSNLPPRTGKARAWAHLRFSVIGSLLADPPPPGELGDELRKLAARTWRHPIEDRLVQFGMSTIERWFYDARSVDDPIAKLSRAVRSDAGREKAMSPRLIEELGRQYGAHPGWSYKLHADNLGAMVTADPAMWGTGPPPSYTTVRRAMKRRGWVKRRVPRHPTPGQRRALERLENRERRSYEAAAVHALWHLDFHVGRRRVADAKGEWHTPVLMGILDDRSRLCCHLQWYFAETAENLIHSLVQALLKRGLPRALMHDNGAAMIAGETQCGLERLGINADPTLPYSPDQNGKQERFWGGVEGRLMAMLERVEPLSLDFLNRATAAWVEGDYNHRVHEEIDEKPIDRMLAGPDVSRPAPSTDTLKRAFTRVARRTQRTGDGTVSIDGVRFELPSRLRTLLRPTVRWREWDLSMAWVVDERHADDVLAVIRPLDREKNASGERRALAPLADGAVPKGPPAEPIPPLLKKLLADYAATGLPPAYLPKDEREPEEDPDA